jgi:murein DD-endopeptidase MepM/ murein hydrolase activator NlpD
MSSLHHDRLLAEGPAPKLGATKAPAVARGATSSRRAATTEDKAAQTAPTPGTRAARTAATPNPRGTTKAAAAEARTPSRTSTKVSTRAARAKPAPAEAAAATTAPAKTAPAKTASTKASPAKASAAKAGPAKAGPAKAGPAKASSAKAAGEKKPRPASPRTSESAADTSATPARRRPSPRPRPALDDQDVVNTPMALAAEETPAVVPSPPDAADPTEGAQNEPVAGEAATDDPSSLGEPAESRRRRWLRRPTARRHRSTLYVSAALVGVLSVGSVIADDLAAQAETRQAVSESVSVARELGITAHTGDRLTITAAGDQLSELVASRSERETEDAKAAQAQQRADKAARARKAAAAAAAARPKAVLPVKGARLTTCFCMRWGTMHYGIDLAAPMRTPEYAAMDGVVLEAGPASGFGLAVYIQHANGDVTLYGHMDKILVTAGQVVKAGDTIALLGNRGQSTGPHLHFEVHVGGINGQKVDPIPWLAARGVHV